MRQVQPVVLFTDPLFQRHDTGRHPENPKRLVRVVERLDEAGMLARCRRGTYVPATEAQVSRAHDSAVAARAKALGEQGGGRLDADTPTEPCARWGSP